MAALQITSGLEVQQSDLHNLCLVLADLKKRQVTLPSDLLNLHVLGFLSEEPKPPPPLPHTVTCDYDAQKHCYNVIWFGDANKLFRKCDRAVSPSFHVSLGPSYPEVTCKLMIGAKSQSQFSSNFQESGGRGQIQLKCEDEVAHDVVDINFSFAIGNGKQAKPTRGPESHSFARSAVCGLKFQGAQELWDFCDVIDHDSMTFSVRAKIELPKLDGGREVA